MSMEHALQPIAGWHTNCEKRLRMGKHPTISSGIMTRNMGQGLREWPQRVGARCFELHIELLRNCLKKDSDEQDVLQ